jgi:hypothetical protein
MCASCDSSHRLAGVHLAGNSLVTQHIAYADVLWRALFYGWAYAAVALLIAALLRNQVASVVVLFMIPSTVESILTLLIKDKSQYLPFRVLGSVIEKGGSLSYGHAAMLFVLYLAIGWVVACFLFLKRDAN